MLAVAGNHDSAGRLNFGSSLMSDSGLHIKGQFTKDHAPIVLHDEYGEVHFHLVPYAEPASVRTILEDDSIRSHQEAMEKLSTILGKV